MEFGKLNIGDKFDFIDDKNPFNTTTWDKCEKISQRKYRSGDRTYPISGKVVVYHVNSPDRDIGPSR